MSVKFQEKVGEAVPERRSVQATEPDHEGKMSGLSHVTCHSYDDDDIMCAVCVHL